MNAKGEVILPRTDSVHASHPGYVHTASFIQIDKEQTAVLISLWSGVSLYGRVLRPDGKPAANARVHLSARVNNLDVMQRLRISSNLNQSWDHGQFANWSFTAKTDANGRFAASCPEEISWQQVNCQVDGFVPFSCVTKPLPPEALGVGLKPSMIANSSRSGADDSELLIQLEKGVVVKSRVLDAAGKPVKGVSVATKTAAPHVHLAFGSSDPNGNLMERVLSPGEYLFELRGPAPNRPGPQQLRSRELGRQPLNPSDLPPPFKLCGREVPDDQAFVEFEFRALPEVLVQFEYEDHRPGERDPTRFVISGNVPGPKGTSQPWRTSLWNCLVDGKERLCARIPIGLQFARINLHSSGGVYHFTPEGAGKPQIGNVDLGAIEASSVVGKIAAWPECRVIMNFQGATNPHFGVDDIWVEIDGPLGVRRRKIHSLDSGNRAIIDGLHANDEVTYHVKNERFKAIEGKAKPVASGETLTVDIQLEAHPNKR